MKRVLALLLTTIMVMTLVLTSCGGKNDPTKTSTTPTETTTPTFVKRDIPEGCVENGAKDLIIVSENLYQFVNESSFIPSKGTVVNTVLDYADGNSNQWYPLVFKFGWEDTADQKYVFVLSEDDKFTNPLKYNTDVNYVEITNLKVGTTYYWKATNLAGTDVTPVNTFSTAANQVRTLQIGNIHVYGDKEATDYVDNTRDIGGYITEDGEYRVRQGLIFRTAKLEDAGEKAIKTLVNELGVKTEIDLRGQDDEGAPVEAIVNAGVNYYCLNWVGYTSIFEFDKVEKITKNDVKQDVKLVDEIKETFAILGNKDNYPILYHCAIGTDRTGTLTFLIQALLGMAEEDINENFQLSWFYRLSDPLTDRYTGNYADMFKGMSKGKSNGVTFGSASNTLAENAEAYLLYIGVTQEQIDTVREVMLEKITVNE